MGRHHAGDVSYPNIKEKKVEYIDWFYVAQDKGELRDFVDTVRIFGFHKKLENSLQD